jgi:hypothetical protein
MRLFVSLSAALTLAAFAAPVLAAHRTTLLYAAGPGRPAHLGLGINPPHRSRHQAAPPSSGWGQRSAQAAPAPRRAPAGARPARRPPHPRPPSGRALEAAAGPQRDCMGEIHAAAGRRRSERAEPSRPAAATKKQPVVCQAFRNLAAAEGKVIKYFEDHGAECRVPPDALKARQGQFRQDRRDPHQGLRHRRGPRPRALRASATRSAPPSIPSVSTDTPAAKSRGSTFDTLTGNPLTR